MIPSPLTLRRRRKPDGPRRGATLTRLLAMALSAGVWGAVGFGASGGWASPFQPLIPLADPAGQRLLMGAADRSDYGPLAQWFETQANLAYCGVASAVMVLNSLAVPAPPVPDFGAYRFWTQTNAFSIPGSRGFVRPEVVAREGMTLAQLHGWLSNRTDLVVERFHGDQLSLAQWRALLRRSLRDPRDRLLVNYQRSALGQEGEGHISPLGAYDPASDRVLILDVARYRHPALWVSAAALWQAMRTTDAGAGRSRGLLLIRPSSPSPPPTASSPSSG
ncbi:MAG: phytochelatin synthase family protein [Cyanobacteriota bacterium]|nr:phytochelatin synthase family protein [Cyanobacteriota bacterium]